MHYSFDVEIAKEYGVNEAIMINNLQHWITINKAKGQNFHDGLYWTFNSVKALERIFPFWTRNQIEYILKKLVDKNVLLKGNYNKTPYDQTKWYAFFNEEKFLLGMDIDDLGFDNNSNSEKSEFEIKDIRNQIQKNPQPIPDTKTQIVNTDKKKGSVSSKKKDTNRSLDLALDSEILKEKSSSSEEDKKKISLVFKTKSAAAADWILTEEFFESLKDTYGDQGIDIFLECKKARDWLIDHPRKRKTLSGMPRFLRDWMSRAVEYSRKSNNSNGKSNGKFTYKGYLDEYGHNEATRLAKIGHEL